MRKTILTIIAAVLTIGAAPTVHAETSVNNERGTINWHDCDAANQEAGATLEGYECGTLTVPLDWDNLANPANAQIAVVIHRTTSPKRIGALTFNPGGPGISGISRAKEYATSIPTKIFTAFDFVAWDPRGVGLSQPQLVNCPAPSKSFPPATGPVDWENYVTQTYDIVGAANKACLDNNKDLAPYLGTYYVIRDLEAMRVALNFKKWNFMGDSYGSRVGYWYAREYPKSLRTLVLDGTYSPTLTATSWLAEQSYSYSSAQTVFTSLPGTSTPWKLERIFDALNEREVLVNGITSSRWVVAAEFFSLVPYQLDYQQIVEHVNIVYDALFNPNKSTTPPSTPIDNEEFTSNEISILYVVNCRDLTDYPTVKEVAAAAEAASFTSMGTALQIVQDGVNCAGFPDDFFHGYLPATGQLRLKYSPVVVHSVGDPLLSYRGAMEMASFLRGAALITYGGTQHVNYIGGPDSVCVNGAVTNYLLTAKTPVSRFCKYVERSWSAG